MAWCQELGDGAKSFTREAPTLNDEQKILIGDVSGLNGAVESAVHQAPMLTYEAKSTTHEPRDLTKEPEILSLEA